MVRGIAAWPRHPPPLALGTRVTQAPRVSPSPPPPADPQSWGPGGGHVLCHPSQFQSLRDPRGPQHEGLADHGPCTLRQVAVPRPQGQRTQDTADSKQGSPDLRSCLCGPHPGTGSSLSSDSPAAGKEVCLLVRLTGEKATLCAGAVLASTRQCAGPGLSHPPVTGV